MTVIKSKSSVKESMLQYTALTVILQPAEIAILFQAVNPVKLHGIFVYDAVVR